jgi:hypothetical protein
MTTPTPSGPITAGRDIVARTINTGHITQDTHLHIHVIEERLEQLAGLLAQPDATLQPSASGSLQVTARTHESLLLPENLLRAWHLLPQAVDARLELRRRAYAAWLLTQRPTRPSQEVAARQHYVPLAGWVNFHDLHFTLWNAGAAHARTGRCPRNRWARGTRSRSPRQQGGSRLPSWRQG